MDEITIDLKNLPFRFFHTVLTEDYGICYTYNSPHLTSGNKTYPIEHTRKAFKPVSSYYIGPKVS